MKKKKILIILIAAAVFTPPAAVLRSMAVMGIYSHIHEKNSIPAKEGFEIKIPGGQPGSGWYPFVMTFNDDAGFQRFCKNEDLSLTILYNFPAFDPLKGCSRLFDPSSPYCSSFYGAYIVQDSAGVYGFNADGTVNSQAVSQVPRFDMKYLVLGDFGLENMVFDWDIKSASECGYIGYDGWTKFDADIKISSAAHEPDGFAMSYLQYGRPNFKTDKNFPVIDMYGRVYAKYFEEYSSSIYFYVIAADRQVLKECDKNILSRSTIK